MQYGGYDCREAALRDYMRPSFIFTTRKTIKLVFQDSEIKHLDRVCSFVNNLESFLGIEESVFKKKGNFVTVKFSKDWLYSTVFFSLYLTSFRVALRNSTDSCLKLKANKDELYVYQKAHYTRAFNDYKRALPLIKKMGEFGFKNVLNKTRQLIVSNRNYASYGINSFLDKDSTIYSVERTNIFLKQGFKIK